ncbi:Vigilin [Schizosaccharomyces pombe]
MEHLSNLEQPTTMDSYDFQKLTNDENLQGTESQVPSGSKSASTNGLLSAASSAAGSSFGLTPSAILQQKHENAQQGKKQNNSKSFSKKPAIDVHSEDAFPTLLSKTGPSKPRIVSWVRKTASNTSVAGSDSVSRDKIPFSASSRASSTKSTLSSVKETDFVTETLILSPDNQAPRMSFVGKPNSVAEIVRTVMHQTSTRINVSTASKTKNTTFLIQGKTSAVKAARRQILKSIGRRETKTMPCPVFVVGAIIGTNGQNLKSIMDRTSTRIQIPKRNNTANESSDDAKKPEKEENSAASTLDDLEPQYEMTTITIEGDFEGVELAQKDIEAIINERTSNTTVRITHISTELYSLLRGPDGKNIKELEEGRDLKVQIPFAYLDPSAPVNPIVLSGEKSAVRECALYLQGQAEELLRTTIPTMLPIPRRQHRFINGEKGVGIQDILRKSGCSVILPPINGDSDVVSVRGPALNISEGIRLTLERANSTIVDAVNITTAYASSKNPFDIASIVARLFLRSRKLIPLEEECAVQYHLPKREELQSNSNKTVIIEISGKSQEAVREGRAKLLALVNQFPESKFYKVTIDPLLQRYVIGSKGKNLQKLRNEHQVELLVGEYGEEDPDVIVCYIGADDGKSPDQIQKELADLAESVKSSAEASAKIVSEIIQVPSVYHKHIVGPKGTTLNAIIGKSEENVIVQLGKVSYRPDSTDDDVYIRGFSKDVERVVSEIKQVVRDAKNHEILHSHVEEFDFPAQYSKNVIGKNGSNVSSLREDLGVQINVEEGHIRIQGIKKNVEETAARIKSQIEALIDDTILRVNIPNDFHRQLIGSNGKYVRRLEEKFSVRVRFPREDDSSNSTGNELMKPTSPDEVVIRGGKKSVAAAKQELLELYEYEKSIAYTSTIDIPSKAVSRVVGRNGSTVENIRTQFDVKIDIGDVSTEEITPVSVRGAKADVENAIKEISAIAEEVKNLVEKVIKIDREYHRYLIGPNGSKLQNTIKECGGSTDKTETARLISFSNGNSEEERNSVVLRGDKEIVEALETRLLEIVEELKNQVEEKIEVPQRCISSIIGRMGSTRRDIERKTSTMLNIPNVLDPEETVTITIVGSPENCEKAKEMIQEKVASQYTQMITVPDTVYESIMKGILMKKLRSDLKVFVDTPEIKPVQPTEVVLEDHEDGVFPWKLVTHDYTGSSSSEWAVRGHKENVEKAIASLEKSIKQVMENCIAYLGIPTNLHRRIIGSGGSVINKIRKIAQVKIDVPRTPGDEIVVVQGSRAGVVKAKDLIFERLQENQNQE